MQDKSNVSSPDAGPYTTEDDTLPSIENIPTIELEPTTDGEELTDHGATTDLEGTTQIELYANIDLEKGRPSQDDALNYDGHDVSVFGRKVHLIPSLAPLENERTSTSLRGSVREFFEGHEEGKKAMDYEQGLTLRYTITHFLPALFWALCMAALCISDGYESNVVTGFLSYQPFCRHYGRIPEPPDWREPLSIKNDNDRNGVMDFRIRIEWQILINLLPAFGGFIGLLSATPMVNSLGYRKCVMIALVIACFFLPVPLISTVHLGISPDGFKSIFVVGELFLGIPWGIIAGIVGSYASDITPLRLRVFASTMVNIFYLIGAMASMLTLQGFGRLGAQFGDLSHPSIHTAYPSTVEQRDLWAIRGPMLMQFLWIVRKGNDAEALKCLRRLNQDPAYNPETALDAIKTVDERERKHSESGGLRACFTKQNRRRTEIAAMVMITQQFVGQQLVNYGVKLLQGSGLNQSLALWCSLAIFAACMGANFSSIWIMKRFGRRKSWLWGLSGVIFCLALIGAFGFVAPGGSSPGGPMGDLSSWGVAATTVVFAFIFNFTIAPISFTILAETPSSRLKTATNSAARCSFLILNMSNGVILQYILSNPPEGWGFGSRVAVVWVATASACLVWAFFRLPEMKDRTPAEIDILFDKMVPARHWAEQELD